MDQKLIKHPGVRALFFIQIFSTLGFSVLYSTLVLFITKKLNLPDTLATTITASFVAFNYALHLLGGFVSGRFFSHRTLFLIGMVSQFLGCILLSFSTLFYLYWGLSFFLVGSGLNVTCVNCMLTQFFAPHEKKRETAFLWNYSGMNIGFFIGFSLSGIFELTQRYGELFLLSASSNCLVIIILLFNFKYLFDQKTIFTQGKNKWLLRSIGFSIIVALAIGLNWLLKHASFSNNMILSIGILMAFIIGFIAIRQKKKKESEKIFAYLILAVMSLIFFTLYTMAPLGLILFIENNVNRHIMGFFIPPQWFQNINSILIILGGPTLAYLYTRLRKKGWRITIPRQFSFALLLIGLAFIVLAISIFFANKNGYINFSWIVISYFLQSMGELFISPIGYAMIGQLIPHRLQAVMMGNWMMITGVAATLSNIFSKMAIGKSASVDPLITNPFFSKIFSILGTGALFAGIVMLFLVPFLNRLIKEEEPHVDVSVYPT